MKEGAEKAKGELEKAKKEFEDRLQDDFSDKGKNFYHKKVSEKIKICYAIV